MSDADEHNTHESCAQLRITEDVARRAWQRLGDPRQIVRISDISASVSTNKVFDLSFSDGSELIVKTSTYGSYVHFRQDHRIIAQWIRRLGGTRYRDFLAPIVTKEDHEVFTTKEGPVWVVFYEKAKYENFLPPVLSDDQVSSWGAELAEFHRASAQIAPKLLLSWKNLGSDVASLYDAIDSPAWRKEHQLDDSAVGILHDQCDQFFTNAERLGYHQFPKIPLLVDWNIGNFSVGLQQDGFKLFSRWDYDWFRVEPRALDFYFCARVTRAEGDQATFSYTVDPFFEPRFLHFLRTYHHAFPLTDEEVLFTKEAYRAFLLNYVMRIGEHFFRPEICRRLQREAVQKYFPVLDQTSFKPLLSALS